MIVVQAQGFNDGNIDDKLVTLTPMINATTKAVYLTNAGQALYGWRCGSTTDGTTIMSKFLPGSCRG